MVLFVAFYGSWWRYTVVKMSVPMSKVPGTSHFICVLRHYSDAITRAVASQITGVAIVYSTVCSYADQRKHQRFASLGFVRGVRRWPVNSPHKGPATRKLFPFDDVFMQFCDRGRVKQLSISQLTLFSKQRAWVKYIVTGLPTNKYDFKSVDSPSLKASNGGGVSISWLDHNVSHKYQRLNTIRSQPEILCFKDIKSIAITI